ncbi:hypothetical protein JF540_24595 [Salipiger thiooxidans]|uniref:hypothetical protein n=1 Tax=Salipiger thiooxidans TaxID=282683 RepID=UPI001A8C6E40|nr:hypothetical protein [Salipiger thiooxidans]MBN8189869.1 hypothetical protein [Salipiger thiooxidans]
MTDTTPTPILPPFLRDLMAHYRRGRQRRLEQALRRDLPLHLLRDIGLADDAPLRRLPPIGAER